MSVIALKYLYILAEICIQMRYFNWKIAKIAQLWGLRPRPQNLANLSPIGKSWLRHCLSLCPNFLTPFAFHFPFWLVYNLAYLVIYVVVYAQ